MVSRLYLWGQSRDILDRKTPRSAGNARWAPASLLAASPPGTPSTCDERGKLSDRPQLCGV